MNLTDMTPAEYGEQDAQWWEYLAARRNAYDNGMNLRRRSTQDQRAQGATG